MLVSACDRCKSTVALRIVRVQSCIEALTTREEDLRSEVALLETEHAVKVEAPEALADSVGRGDVRVRCSQARAGHLDLLDVRKILEEESVNLS